MPQSVSVHLLPQLLPTEGLSGGVAVVIDVLRASTTIVHALANGAAGVIPCETVDEARAAASARPADQTLLGGERGGERIEGFDLDNSPFSYTTEIVQDKTIVFTTTNGTTALRESESASRVLIGAFVNRAAVIDVLRTDGRPVQLVCAGSNGKLTAEDVLFAGSVAADLVDESIDVQTQLAIEFYCSRAGDDARLLETMRTSLGGANLVRLGFDADIERASQWDRFSYVPEWSAETNTIR